MTSIQFNHIQDLISSIQKEKAQINSVQVDERILDKIENILRQNRPLFEKWRSYSTSLHFIKAVIPLCSIRNTLREFTDIAAFSLSNLNERDVVHFFSEMKKVDEELAFKALGKWCNQRGAFLNQIGLEKNDLIRLAPHLTVLRVSGSFAKEGFSVGFIDKLLKECHNLTDLTIEKSELTGDSLAALPHPEQLRNLTVFNCPAFDCDLPSGLKTFQISYCSSFNQDLSSLTDLETVKISNCQSFDQSFVGLENLKKITVESCGNFTGNFLDLKHLKTLKIDKCPVFNGLLSNLPGLRTLEIQMCRLFNRPLKGFVNLIELALSYCQSFNEIISGMTSLKSFTMNSCEAYSREFGHFPALESLFLVECKRLTTLCGIENLRNLKVERCDAFNGDLSHLVHLVTLEMTDCLAFNQNVSGLPLLKRVDITFCRSFNGKFCDLAALEDLSINHCVFDQSISGLPSLTQLHLSHCQNFNSPLSELRSLGTLSIVRCGNFNQNLHGFEQLQYFEMTSCKSFNPFNLSLETLQFFMNKGQLGTLCAFFNDLQPGRKQELIKDERNLIDKVIAKATDKDEKGFSYLDYLVIPPAISLEEYLPILVMIHTVSLGRSAIFSFSRYYRESSTFKEELLLNEVWRRVCERHPKFVRGEEDIPELEGFIEEVISTKEKPYLFNLLQWDYKMNPALPMTGKGFKAIRGLIEGFPDHLARVRLALQTCSEFSEIKKAVRTGALGQPFPSKEVFFQLAQNEQEGLLCRAVVFRERAALRVANQALKDARSVRPKILYYAIKLLESTGMEGSSKTIERLMEVIRSPFFPADVRCQACLSLAEIDPDPMNEERKMLMVAILEKPQLRQSAVASLGKYHFKEEDLAIARRLIELSRAVEEDALRISIAFTLSVMPIEEALHEALMIVNSPVWDSVDQGTSGYEKLGRKGDFEMYTYQPIFYHSRSYMKRVIAERMVEMRRPHFRSEVDARVKKWRIDPDQFPTLNIVEKNIRGIENGLRYIPFPLYLPSNRIVFRGICERKGSDLFDAAFFDLMAKGSGSLDLSKLISHDHATWAKLGQMFNSVTLEYVMRNFFDENGVLMAISSDAVNELQLRRRVRLQREASLHPVVYGTIRNDHIMRLFMSSQRKSGLADLNGKYHRGEKDRALFPTVHKIAMKHWNRSIEQKVSYLNPYANLKEQVMQEIERKGLLMIELDEIIEENIQRQVIRELLAEQIADADLKECLKFASEVSESVILAG